jgi:hypothetical protein
MTESRDAVQLPPENTATDGTGWYLYGITRAAPALADTLTAAPGFDAGERAPEVLDLGDLAAVVRAVRLSDFEPETLAQRSDDPAWLEQMVRGHNDVIAAVHEQQAILPAKFGSVFAGTADLRDALNPMRAELTTQLERLQGADEWAVHLYVDPSLVEQRVAAESPAVAALRQEAADARPGRAYFLQRKIADTTAAETEAALGERADAAYERLAVHARDARISPAGSGRSAAGRLEILKAAFLVSRDDVDGFLADVSDLNGAEDGTTAECSGPWPPYSFAGEELL